MNARLACLAGLAGLVSAGCSLGSVGQFKGQTPPDFTLTSLDGTGVTLSEQRGKVVLLAFWGVG